MSDEGAPTNSDEAVSSVFAATAKESHEQIAESKASSDVKSDEASKKLPTPINKARKVGAELTVTCEVIGALKKLLVPKKGRPPKVTDLQISVPPNCTRHQMLEIIGDKLQTDPLRIRINYKQVECCNVVITKGIVSFLVEPPEDDP